MTNSAVAPILIRFIIISGFLIYLCNSSYILRLRSSYCSGVCEAYFASHVE